MKVKIKGESIKLKQFLKKIGETPTGGSGKLFLLHNTVKINGVPPIGGSTKIKPGDIVWVNDILIQVVSDEE
ncbi:RNA-binding S4 domain-containing protein [Mycoplasmopsis cricetuli]|uniref:RNA-binding S4 domain-containing protein n=1 Tax=Mycoplasmopsis cricetuli TaxID=171283 RepID=UPI0004713D8B|nr:RNA-binding S4 domain-containing protein [Mycoplasmopsis cricetuli]